MLRQLQGQIRFFACVAAWFGVFMLLASLVDAPIARAQELGLQASDDTNEVVIFVLDLSGSMNEPFDGERTKLDVAKAAFVEAFANVSPDAQVGLRTYGDQIEPTAPEEREASCTSDSRLASPVGPLQREQLIAQVQRFSALGDTPMSLALEQASKDIPAGSTGTIVLFSDGRDECFDADLDGDAASGPSYGQEPCSVAATITAGESAVDRVVTVGFRADQEAAIELRCIANATGGSYTPIESPEDARDVLPELLVRLSSNREAERLIGREIQGATSIDDDVPSFDRLDETQADRGLYTDSLDMNSVRVYRFDDYGPDGGTLTATAFGLPAEADITFDLWAWVPALNREFFAGKHAATNAGLPARPTASIRCTECTISGGPHDVFWFVSLSSPNEELTGTYEIEILTEGPGFGGPSTSCTAPQECFYPKAIDDLATRLAEAEAALSATAADAASDELLAQRDEVRTQTEIDQAAMTAAETRSAELEALIPTAPSKSNSWMLPLLMIAGGIGLATAPFDKLKRRRKDEDLDSEPLEQHNEPATPAPAAPDLPSTGGPALVVGPTPAVNEAMAGNSWDAELEAAKAALAQQRPDREATEAEGLPPRAAIPALPVGATPEPTAKPEPTQPEPQPAATPEPTQPEPTAAIALGSPTADLESQPAETPEPAATSQPEPQPAATPEPQPEPQPAATPDPQPAATPQPVAANLPKPGWYQDPSGAGQFRWWNGQQWTEHTSQPSESGGQQ